MFGDFFKELSKRRVPKAAIVYIVMAWLLIQVSAEIFPALLLPSWTLTFVVVLAIIGFPIVVVLAWIFDITPGGVKRTSDLELAEEKKERGQEPPRIDAPPTADSALASIAVLPFEALSADPQDEFLARGIAAEISSALAHLPEVRVAPSRSASALDETTELQTIGKILDVQYLLSGKVKRSGKLLRVLAELSDTRRGVVLWSEAYDREAEHLMQVEEEIASAIVGSFGGEQLREQIRNAHDHATSSTEARSLVHRARAYVLDYSKSALIDAEKFAREAIGLDPDYASAQAALASVLSEKVTSGFSENAESDLAEALTAINIAVERRPQDPFVLKLAGNVWAGAGDHVRAIATLRRAIEIAPFDFGTWGYLAFVLASSGDTGRTNEAHSILDRIIEAAPQHPGQAYWMHHKAVAFTAEEQFAEAASSAKMAVDRQPGLAWAWYLYANALASIDDPQGATVAAKRANEANPELSIEEFAAIVKRTSGSTEVCKLRLAGLKTLGVLHSG